MSITVSIKKYCIVFLSLCYFTIAGWSQGRQMISINSGWQFVLNDSLSTQSPWQEINLPHTWNNLDIIDETPGYYQGIGWYKRELIFPDQDRGKHIELYFEGVCNKAEVFVNAKKAVVHYGGFTGFTVDITPFLQYGNVGNTILVKADNSKYLRDSVPPYSADFNLMGGIYRDVWMISTNPVHFSGSYGSKGIFFETPEVSESSAGFIVKGNIDAGNSQEKLQVNYTLWDNNKIVQTGTTGLDPSQESSFQLQGKLKQPHLWSPEDPYLYQVQVKLMDSQQKILDELSFPVGFKWVSIGLNEQFFLNGKPYKLKGASRHQDYDHMGTAMTDPMHVRDIQLMKDMGCNFIRIAHYPQDPAIYAACDRLGLLAWNEIPVVDRVVDNPAFFAHSATMMHEMIAQHFNHPSIAIWGFQNEVRNLDVADIKHARMMDSIARSTDPMRLTAMAFETNLEAPFFKNPLVSQILNIPDIIGYNVYQGWYRAGLHKIGSFLDTLHQFNPHKPILLSEYGAGSSIGIHSFHPTLFDFSEEYQCSFQEPYLEAGNKRPWMIGFAIWNFIDFQRDGREDVQPNYNNKGMVTTDRRYKDVYYLYKSKWSKDPFIYINGKHWPKRYFFTSGQTEVSMPVLVYSNQKNINVLHNGKPVKVDKTVEGTYSGVAKMSPGKNQFVCTGKDGRQADAFDMECVFIDTTAFSKKFPEEGFCFNTGQTHSFFEDASSHQNWLPDKAFSKGTWGYVGGKVFDIWPGSSAWNGIRQGINKPITATANEPVFQTFVEGLTAWKAQIPAGVYRITVLLAEPFTLQQRKSEARIFDLLLNGEPWMSQLNIEQQFGIQRAVLLDKVITVKNQEGIVIEFQARSGKTILNGVSIQKL